jgi:hypothetical protein
LIPGRARKFSLFHLVQTGFGAHPASYPMGAGNLSPGREDKLSPIPSAEVKDGGYIPPLPMHLFGIS